MVGSNISFGGLNFKVSESKHFSLDFGMFKFKTGYTCSESGRLKLKYEHKIKPEGTEMSQCILCSFLTLKSLV